MKFWKKLFVKKIRQIIGYLEIRAKGLEILATP